MTFRRHIGPFALLLAGMSCMIGSGWLFGPLYAAQVAGPAAALSWIIGGALMLIVSLSFAELGSAFPVAGGIVQFAQHSHGPLISFMIGWMVWISSLAVAPVETLALLQYAANYLPLLIQPSQGAPVLTGIGMLAAAVVMFIMSYLNYHGARFFSRASSVITVIKLMVPLITIVLLISANFHFSHFYAQSSGGFLPFGWHGVLTALPVAGVIYSFIGSSSVLQLAAETKNPQRSIPLALIGSMLFCMVLYAALQIAFVGAVSPSDLAQGWQHLHYLGDSGPFAGIMTALGLGWFVILIYGDAFISPFGTGFVFTASTARVTYGLSEIGFLPVLFKKLTAKGIPLQGVILNYLLGLLLFLPFPGWQKLVGFITSCFIISYIIGPLALISLRKTHANLHRPFHLPQARIISLLGFYICNLLIYWTGWTTVSRMMIALCIGILWFFLSCAKPQHRAWISEWRSAWWILPYFGGLTLISYAGSFGGGRNLLSFGWDFLALAVFTLVIYEVTKFCRASDPNLSID